MQLSSQGLNFLGLTAKRYEAASMSRNALNVVQEKLGAFEEVGNALANTNIALNNLKSINCQAYCVVEGKKQAISEKSWDRGGLLEGKMPLEEGIAKGLYHIEKMNPPVEMTDLDEILEELQKQVSSDAEALLAQKEKKNLFEEKESVKDPKKKLNPGSSFKFVS